MSEGKGTNGRRPSREELLAELDLAGKRIRELERAQNESGATLDGYGLQACLDGSGDFPDLFRATFEYSPVGIALVSLDFQLLRVNRAYCRLLGYNEEELRGMALAEFTHADDLKENLHLQTRLGAGEIDSYQMEKRFVRRDGRIVHGFLVATLIKSPEGAPLFFLGQVLDITERKAMEAALAESEREKSSILDHQPDFVVLQNLNHEVLWVNKTASDAAEISREDMVGRTCHQLFQGMDEPCEECPVREAGIAGAPQVGEKSMPDGRICRIQAVPIRDETGRVMQVLELAEDITRQRRSELATRESEHRYRMLYESMREGVAVHEIVRDEAGYVVNYRIQDVNPSYEAILGLSSEDVLGRLATEAYKSSAPPYLDIYASVAETGTPVAFETLHKPMGKYFNISVSPAGPGRFVTLFQDVTEQRLAAHRLLESEARFRAIFEQAGVGICLLDPQGRYFRVNDRFCEIAGYEGEELLGRSFEDVIFKDDLQDAVLSLSRVLHGEIDSYSMEKRYVRKDGAVVWANVTVSLSRTQSGEPSFFIVVVRDISARKEAEEAADLARWKAEEANEAKSRFLANMSHEIRTPLNGVLGMLQLLQGSRLDESQEQCVHNALGACKRLGGLLSDILDLSRIEARKMALRRQVFDIREVAGLVREMLSFEAERKGLVLATELSDDLPRQVVGDPTRLQQILLNLAGNAVKFSTQGEVRLQVHPLPNSAGAPRYLFSVSDKGPGFDEDSLLELLEPFTQQEDAYSREHQGAGLGLAIVDRLVRLMGGSLVVDTAPGQGATFYVCLPFDAPEETPQAVGEPVAEEAPIAGLRILLVEDEPVNRLAMSRLLEKHGFRIETAENGEQALQMLKGGDRFDVVLMDVQMPVMDGIEASVLIRSSPELAPASGIPIIALTAYAMPGDREEFLAAGMDGYLAKPVETRDLLAELGRVAGLRRPGTESGPRD